MAVQLQGQTSTPESSRLSQRALSVAVALSAAYLFYVIHFSVDELFSDEWFVVPMVHAALHGHLTFSMLWAQHSDNRMLVPNVLFVVLGTLTHYDTRVIVFVSALVSIAAFGVFLYLFWDYLRRPVSAAAVLVTGVIWFGLEDWENSLLSFQLAWYLIVAFVMVMLYALLRRPLWLAIVCAFAASYCSFQGLALWPVGLICLLWLGTKRRKLALWLVASVVGIGLYFWHYTSTPAIRYTFLGNTGSVSVSYAVRHPVELVQFFLIDIGQVIHTHQFWLSGVVGTLILAAAVVVVVQSIPRREGFLPVGLISFGLLFDAFIAVGRIPYGLTAATQSHYTMPNVLILVAVITYGWDRVTHEWAIVGLALVAVFFGVTTVQGLQGSETFDNTLHTGARLVVNRDEVPSDVRDCYSLYGFFVDVNPVPTTQSPLFDEAQKDRLGAFGAPYWTYRAEGLPVIRQCR